MNNTSYWNGNLLGFNYFKIKHYLKLCLYKTLGITLPKLKDQREYWDRRGVSYMDEVFEWGYHDREIFFQNMLIDELRSLDFDSFFEAGCGFGWNVKRVKQEFAGKMVGGLDFSFTQLSSSQKFLAGIDIPVANGDNCAMPFKDNAFDVGFSLGVFMNIHPSRIEDALREMTRVCKKYIIHLEYDQNHTSRSLREQRAFKTNIISHDYKGLYESLGKKVVKFETYHDFGNRYSEFEKTVNTKDTRWEGFEGPEKYIFILVEV